MGVFTFNNMANLCATDPRIHRQTRLTPIRCCADNDTVVHESADLIVHMGDHAYNEGDGDERRADGYLQAYQQTIANTLFMPIVGNHEVYGTNLSRFLDGTWEKWGPIGGVGEHWGDAPLEGESTVRRTAAPNISALPSPERLSRVGAGDLGARRFPLRR